MATSLKSSGESSNDSKEQMVALQKILSEVKNLQAEVKWGKPAYTYNGKVIVVIQSFKKYFALLFYRGNLLSDPKNILVKTGPNTKVGRQIRFENAGEIRKLGPTIKSYIKEAIKLEDERNKSN